MPHIAMRRADIPEGVLQITDLQPNNSTKNNILQSAEGQTKYVKQPLNEAVGTINPAASQLLTAGPFTGIAAYLLDRVEDQAGGTPALTAAIANDTADLLVARIRAGSTVTAVNVAADLVTSGADGATTLAAGNSTGIIQDVLEILAGRPYVLPDGVEVQAAGGAFNATISGAFDADEPFIGTLTTGALNVSLGGGLLSGFTDPTFDYIGTAGAAVTVYNDDGTLLTV